MSESRVPPEGREEEVVQLTSNPRFTDEPGILLNIQQGIAHIHAKNASPLLQSLMTLLQRKADVSQLHVFLPSPMGC